MISQCVVVLKVSVYAGIWIVFDINVDEHPIYFRKDESRLCYLDALKMKTITLDHHVIILIIV